MKKNLMSSKRRPHLIIPRGVRKGNEPLYCIRSLSFGQMSSSEIEAARKSIRKRLKKKGNLIVRAFAFLPLTKKPAEVRMGKGKGNRVRKVVYPVRPGQVLFELKNVSPATAVGALNSAVIKLSVKAKVFGWVKRTV